MAENSIDIPRCPTCGAKTEFHEETGVTPIAARGQIVGDRGCLEMTDQLEKTLSQALTLDPEQLMQMPAWQLVGIAGAGMEAIRYIHALEMRLEVRLMREDLDRIGLAVAVNTGEWLDDRAIMREFESQGLVAWSRRREKPAKPYIPKSWPRGLGWWHE